ncbi:DUF6911 family protein [Janthinobacterium fluminis]|uniref:Uncharacterized protein n=1 Tax=Janthinobacterium fluminis TaxID=2987524 RepID=A0ABT5JWJ4_9BURK|nr:hypothetical protein [Janthinobacterium fluminis]MDC8757111.1 hypothetical protein [Janthinobacterium fluminis]
MSKEIVLGGYVIDVGGVRHQLPAVLNPIDSIAENVIRNVIGVGKGVVVMRSNPPPESGPYELRMYLDAGYFMLMLNELDEDGDHSVRTPMNAHATNDLVSILGEKYPAKVLVQDIDFVCSVFNEFSHAGTVSTDLLS